MTGSRVDLLVLRWVPTELITRLDEIDPARRPARRRRTRLWAWWPVADPAQSPGSAGRTSTTSASTTRAPPPTRGTSGGKVRVA